MQADRNVRLFLYVQKGLLMKQYLEIGKIVNVHGLRGDMKVVPWCDDPEFLCEFDTLYLGKAQKPVTVTAARLQKGNVLLHLEGVDTVEEAEKYMDRDEVELEEGVYFIQDLIGLEVLDVDTGKSYGKLTDVMQTGANDVYEVKDADGKTVLIPAIPDVVQETDLDGGVMRIRPLEGLFDAD
jgi:16S rRNA processing protein RimM